MGEFKQTFINIAYSKFGIKATDSINFEQAFAILDKIEQLRINSVGYCIFKKPISEERTKINNNMKKHLTTEDVYDLAYEKLDVSNIKVDKEIELANLLGLEFDEDADAYLNPDYE